MKLYINNTYTSFSLGRQWHLLSQPVLLMFILLSILMSTSTLMSMSMSMSILMSMLVRGIMKIDDNSRNARNTTQ